MWQCILRTHPDSAPLADEMWSSAARRVLAATGIAPAGDAAACRWIALRIDDHEVRVIAPLMRQDGQAPRTDRDISRARAVCQLIDLETTGSRRHAAALVHTLPTIAARPTPAAAAASRPDPDRLPAPSR